MIDEKRNIERVIEKVRQQRSTLETQIQELKCAAAPERSLLCQCPLTEKQTKHCLCAYRLDWNKLGPEGGAALAEGIKGNSTLTSLS